MQGKALLPIDAILDSLVDTNFVVAGSVASAQLRHLGATKAADAVMTLLSKKPDSRESLAAFDELQQLANEGDLLQLLEKYGDRLRQPLVVVMEWYGEKTGLDLFPERPATAR